MLQLDPATHSLYVTGNGFYTLGVLLWSAPSLPRETREVMRTVFDEWVCRNPWWFAFIVIGVAALVSLGV